MNQPAQELQLDNLSGKVVAAFSSALARSSADFAGYRAYRLSGGVGEVRVRVLPQARLHALFEAMGRARCLVSDDPAGRRRAASIPG